MATILSKISTVFVLIFSVVLMHAQSPVIGISSSVQSPYAQSNITQDMFNRTGANLGSNWTNYVNGWTPGSGAAGGTTSTAGISNTAAYTGVTTAPTQSVTVVVGSSVSGDYIGAALRISGTIGTSVSFYFCTEGASGIYIGKNTGTGNSTVGTSTLTANAAITRAVGDVIRLSIVGSTLSCSRNGLLALEVQDPSPLTSGYPGVEQTGNGSTLYSFTLTNTGVVKPGCTANIVHDGDSLTYEYGIWSSHTDYTQVSFSTNPCITNLGVSSKAVGVTTSAPNGGNIESMITTGTSVVDTLYTPGIPNIVVLWGGTNDIASGQTPAQAYSSIQTYISARHAAGWKVVLVPPLSRATYDANENILAQLILAGGTGADAVVYLPQALIGSGSYQNTTIFLADGIHIQEFAAVSMMPPAINAALNIVK